MLENNKHSLNLWQKLAAISKEVGHIDKTGKNSHFNYAFMEHSQIVAALRPIMDEYGVTVDLEAMDATFMDGKSTRVLLHMKYTVTNADKPEETFSRLWVSEAMDQQDKGINKALTAAEKNIFMKLFHISDVDLEADENDIQPAKQKPATAPTSRPVTPQAPRPVNPIPPAQIAPRTPQAQPVTPIPAPSSGELATEQQRTAIVNMAGRKGVDDIELNDRLTQLYGVELKALTRNDAAHFIKVFQSQA
jgi:hypothetical protein